MNATSDSAAVALTGSSVKRRRRRSEAPPTPATAQALGQTSSGEANRRAAAILEVLAGERSPSEAAEALEVSLPYFYLLERKALEGLVRACEVQPKGPPPPSAAEKLALVEQQLAAAQRECQRLTALVRVTQRAVGLAGPATGRTAEKPSGKTAGPATGKPGKPSGKRARRRPSIRALRAVETVRKNAERNARKNSLPAAEDEVQRAEVGSMVGSIVGNGSLLAPADREAGAPPS